MRTKGEVNFKISSAEVSISFWFVALAAFYSVSSEKSLYAALAIVCHELAHLLALCLCRGRILKLKFGVTDINFVTNTQDLPPLRQIAIAAAGPLINFCLGLFFYPLNREIAYSNLLIGAFQALPVLSMDGGTIFEVLCGGKREAMRKTVSLVLSFLILLVGITLMVVSRYNFSLLVIGCYLLFLSLSR